MKYIFSAALIIFLTSCTSSVEVQTLETTRQDVTSLQFETEKRVVDLPFSMVGDTFILPFAIVAECHR